MPVSRSLFPAIALAVLMLVLALSGPAAAATKNGITPVAPKAGSSVPAGKSPVFRMKARGPGQVWVHVCKSKSKDSDGVICREESIGRATKKKGRTFEYKPRFFDFATFWLNSPGRYFWQAFRIDCAGDISDCRQEGPITRFRVG
jgi:hypothetical protein